MAFARTLGSNRPLASLGHSGLAAALLVACLAATACTTSSGGGGGSSGGGWQFGDGAGGPGVDSAAATGDGGSVSGATDAAAVSDGSVEEVGSIGLDSGAGPDVTIGEGDVAVDSGGATDDDGSILVSDGGGGPAIGGAAVHGLVLDTDNLPLAGVQVELVDLGNSTITNGAGVFAINKTAAAEGARLRFSRPGFAGIERSVRLVSGEISKVRVRLLAAGPVEVVSGAHGGAAYHPRGNVQFQPASLVDAKGKTYNGEAHVRLTHLDPSTDQIEAAPGEFLALTSQSQLTMLESFAMAEVQLTDPAGQPLQLGPGAKATLDLDLPASTSLKLGDIVPLWHYDEVKQLWVEEGSSKIVKSSRDPKRLAMVGQVGHFSWWNCDKAGSARCITGVVRGCDGKPLSGVTIESRAQGGVNVQDGDSTHAGGLYCVMGMLGQPTTITYRLGNRIAKEIQLIPSGGGAFCGGNCFVQEPITACFDGCARGHVIDATGNAIAGAQVFVPKSSSGSSKDEPAAFSDDGGGFQVEALSLDPMSVTVTKPGYLPATMPTQPVKGEPGTTCPAVPVQVTLEQPCIAGVVKDASGKPVAGAQVQFAPFGKFPASGVATTAGDGGYQLRVAAGASGKLTITAPGLWTSTTPLTITATEACSDATAQAVAPAVLDASGCVTGKVVDAAGKGLAGITVSGGIEGGTQTVASGVGGVFCIEGPVGKGIQVGASGKGLAGTVETVVVGKAGTCGGEAAACGASAVELVMKPTLFDHIEGFWKDCQAVLGDVQVADLQVQGSAKGLEHVQGMHAVGFLEPDGTRRVVIILSDADGPAVLAKGKSLWFIEMAIGPHNPAAVVTYKLPDWDGAPNGKTRLRGQIISKTGGQLGVDGSLYRLSTAVPSTMTVVFADNNPAKAAEGFFSLAFDSECGVATGRAKVQGSFVLKSLLKLPLEDAQSPAAKAWDKCYKGYDGADLWTSTSVGAVTGLTLAGASKPLTGASATAIYAAHNKALLGDAGKQGEGLTLSVSASGVTLQAHLPKLALGKTTLGLGAFCGNLGFLDCCGGTATAPVALSCGSGAVEAKPAGCKTFGVPACPAAVGGAAMTVSNGSCSWKLEPEDATVSLQGTGTVALDGGLAGTLDAKLSKLVSGSPSYCPATQVSVSFQAATCRVAPGAELGFQHAADPAW